MCPRTLGSRDDQPRCLHPFDDTVIFRCGSSILRMDSTRLTGQGLQGRHKRITRMGSTSFRPFSRLWWQPCPRETAPFKEVTRMHRTLRADHERGNVSSAKLHDGQHLAVCTAGPVCVVLNTCRLRSDDLLTFACVPAEEMLLWLQVPLPWGGSQNHCGRDRRAVHIAQCFVSGMSRMSCTTGTARKRNQYS